MARSLSLALFLLLLSPSIVAARSPPRAKRCAAAQLRLPDGRCARLRPSRPPRSVAEQQRTSQRLGETFARDLGPKQRRLLRATRARSRALAPQLSAAMAAASVPGGAHPLARPAAVLLPLPPAPVFGAWTDMPVDGRGVRPDSAQARPIVDNGVTPDDREGDNTGVEVRLTMGDAIAGEIFVRRNSVTQCPDADGVIRGTWEFTLGRTTGSARAGAISWLATARATYAATVGDDARLQRWRYRAEADLEAGGWMAGSNGRRRHIATRRLHSVITRNGLDPRKQSWGDEQTALREYTANPAQIAMRSPTGRSFTLRQYDGLVEQIGRAMGMLEDQAPERMLSAEKSWLDYASCVEIPVEGPARLRKGATGSYTAQPVAKDGQQITGPVTLDASGVTVSPTSATVAPGSPLRVTGRLNADNGSIGVESLSKRGRGKGVVLITAEREEPRRWRFDVTVDYDENMGADVAPLIGAEIDPEDQTVTVTFGVPGRPFDMSWIVTVPLSGGQQAWASDKPFCDRPSGAHTATIVNVTSTQVN